MVGGEERGEVSSAYGVRWGSAEGEDCGGRGWRNGSNGCAEEVFVADLLSYQLFLETGGFVVREETADM